jgi:hypothetical protein
MATSNKAVWQNMQSKLMAMGYGTNVVIGEPRSGMQSGTIAVIPIEGNYDETTLSKPREIHRVNVRMYQNWLEEPQEEVEFLLDQFRADIMEDICGDFDLGGTVAYIVPDEFVWTFDESEVENTLYRVVNCLIAYRVDDQATFVA